MKINNNTLIWVSRNGCEIFLNNKHYIIPNMSKLVFHNVYYNFDVAELLFAKYFPEELVKDKQLDEYKKTILAIINKVVKDVEPQSYKVYIDKEGNGYKYHNNQKIYIYNVEDVKRFAVNELFRMNNSGMISNDNIWQGILQSYYIAKNYYLKDLQYDYRRL